MLYTWQDTASELSEMRLVDGIKRGRERREINVSKHRAVASACEDLRMLGCGGRRDPILPQEARPLSHGTAKALNINLGMSLLAVPTFLVPHRHRNIPTSPPRKTAGQDPPLALPTTTTRSRYSTIYGLCLHRRDRLLCLLLPHPGCLRNPEYRLDFRPFQD